MVENLAKQAGAYSKEQKSAVLVQDGRAYLITKRLLDIVGSTFGIVLLSFLFLLIAIAIKIEDPKGKVFFSQKRVGWNGRTFKMYKFRSMVTNAEEKLAELLKFNEASGAMFKIKDDPRITRVGRFIRRTSFDELPQLFNVLKGDMSLVGPRPPLPAEVAFYSGYDWQRLLVKPGCTGLWQISGRSHLSFHEMVELDLQYMSKRTFWYDLKIIWKTVFVLFGSEDAY